MRPKDILMETPPYMMIHGFLFGLVFGFVFGHITGAVAGAMAGAVGGFLLGLIYDALLYRFGIHVLLHHRALVMFLSGLGVGLLFFLVLSRIFSFERSSADFFYVGLFGVLPSIIYACGAMYSAHLWTKWLQDRDTRKRKVKP
ncbi:MAG: hypothetical protein KC615_16340 [Anaerolineae bacterium]|nr:hypothetical protein [Anaerolineae bacterium]